MRGLRLPGDESFRTSRPLGDDEESFRVLFTHFYRPVFSYFSRRGFPAEEAQDLTQETFLRVYRSLGRFRGEASVRTWLFHIAKNVALNEIRRRAAEKRAATGIPLEEAAQEKSAAEAESEEGAEAEDRAEGLAVAVRQPERLEDILAEERTALLRQALAELPPQMRRCVMLRMGQGLKYREIADAMQISIDTVKSQLFQARTRLKETLSKHFPDIETG